MVRRWRKNEESLQQTSEEQKKIHTPNQSANQTVVQGDQDHFLSKEMLISPSILKLHKNP